MYNETEGLVNKTVRFIKENGVVMTVKHTKSLPIDLRIEGSTTDARTWLHFRNNDKSVITHELNPDLVQVLIHTLLQYVGNSPISEIHALGQSFALRNISAQVHNDFVITLRYELEAGIQLETSFDVEKATTLVEQLQEAISRAPKDPSKTPH